MTLPTVFAIAEASINNVLYPGLKGQEFSRNRRIGSDGMAGTIHETFHTILQQEAAARLQTLALKSILAALNGSSDLPLLVLDGTYGLVMYGAQAAASAPGYSGSSVHHTLTALYGVVYMKAIHWTIGHPAEVELEVMFFDGAGGGATDPITVGTTAALPTQVVPVEQFMLSALTLNGSSVGGVQSCELTFDPKFHYYFSAGNPFPTLVAGGGVQGPCEFRLMASVTDLDLAEGTGSVSVVFSQLSQNSPAFAAHTVTFTYNAAWSLADKVGGRQDGPQTQDIIVRPRYSGSTRPLAWAST